MKKSELKQVISEIVRRKLDEAKHPKYGYIMHGDDETDDSNDPRLQLIGYGNMPKSFWKKKLESYAGELLKRIKDEDWKTAAYFLQQNGVFNSAVNMMKEVTEENLDEQLGSAADDGQNAEEPKADPMGLKKQKELADLKKKQNDLNNNIRKMDANMQKLEDPIRKKTQDIARRKAPEVKKLGTITKQIQDLENT